MIRFFTKTRKRLLAENKYSKYLKYASGEIILIVTGLLIAVQINNWNEGRNQEILIKQYLGDIILDIKKDRKTREGLFKITQFKFHSLQYLLEISGNKPFDISNGLPMDVYVPFGMWEDSIPKTYDESFVRQALIWSQRLLDQRINTKTIEEMKSLGLFSAIQNKKLKNGIDNYYTRNEYNLGEKHYSKHLEIVKEWDLTFVNDGVQLVNIELDSNLTFLKSNEKRIGLIYLMMREAAWVSLSSRRHRENAEGLIEDIENEIGQ